MTRKTVTKPLILVVDDNIINRQYFSMSLKKANCDVIAVESGQQAIEQVTTTKFDVILMDIRMPEMDGYECTRRIRSISPQDTTPIYATSAEELVKEHRDLFTGFLLKPISPKQLKDTISRHINKTPVVFNQEIALKFAYNDKEIVKTLANLFIKELPEQVKLLKEHTFNNEIEACRDLVHKIKGSCRACGAQQIEAILDDFSNTHHENDTDTIQLKLNGLLGALEAYKASTILMRQE